MSRYVYIKVINCDTSNLTNFYEKLKEATTKIHIDTDYDSLDLYPTFRDDDYIQYALCVDIGYEVNIQNVYIVPDSSVESFIYNIMFTNQYGDITYNSVNMRWHPPTQHSNRDVYDNDRYRQNPSQQSPSQQSQQRQNPQNQQNQQMQQMNNPYFSNEKFNKMFDKPYINKYTYEQ